MATYTKRICDRCGNEIKPKVLPFMQVSELKTRYKLGYGEDDYTDCKYDLCSLCCKSFDMWFNLKEKEATK